MLLVQSMYQQRNSGNYSLKQRLKKSTLRRSALGWCVTATIAPNKCVQLPVYLHSLPYRRKASDSVHLHTPYPSLT